VSLRFTKVTNTAIINALNPIATGFEAKIIDKRTFKPDISVMQKVVFVMKEGRIYKHETDTSEKQTTSVNIP